MNKLNFRRLWSYAFYAKIAKFLLKGASSVLNFFLEWPGFIAILVIVAVVFAGVIARYVFHFPLHFVYEYAGYANAVIIFFALGWVLKHATHIRINLLINALPKKLASYIEIINIVVSLVVVIVLVIATAQLAIHSIAIGLKAWSVMETPLGPVQLIMPIGLGLFAIQIAIDIVRRVKALRQPPAQITEK